MKIVHGSPGFGSMLTEGQTTKFLTDKKLNLFGLTLWRPIFWVGDAGRAINLVINSDKEIVENQIFNCGNNSENYQIKQN